ncbi:hypothetical protein LXL04_030284 [Taraxacum kok-saghyz]
MDTVGVRAGVRRSLEAVGLVLLWSIWSFQNKMFNQVKPVKALIRDHIQAPSFLWIALEIQTWKVVGIQVYEVSNRMPKIEQQRNITLRRRYDMMISRRA